MQPLKLTITGDFWDSHIYRGRLYLWDAEGALHIFHWDRFIEHIADSTRQQLFYSAFARGDSLYRDFLSSSLVKDPDVLSLVKSKLEALADMELTFQLADLEPFRMGAQDTPFAELHDDLVIFKNTAYALTEAGFLSSTVHTPKRNKYAARPAEKIWNGRGVSLSASRSGLAIAAASDGLFEYANWMAEPEQVSEWYTTFAHWLFASIYASSSSGHGYLAGYKWVHEMEDDGWRSWRRRFGGILPESEVFESSRSKGNGHLTWGSQEKLYKARSDRIEVVRFIQKYLWERDSTAHSPFQTIGEIPIRNGLLAAQPISAGVAFFGSIVEYPDCLYVLESDSTLYCIPGETSRWRVFPRSHWYPNHLHVVLEDHLEVLSFNGDLFSDQRAKLAGIEFQQKMLGEI